MPRNKKNRSHRAPRQASRGRASRSAPRHRAIAVILSGKGSDGAAGIREIKAQGGLTIAQSPESAKYDAMPRAAIDTGLIDLVLTPEEIADHIAQLPSHPYLADAPAPAREAEGRLVELRRELGANREYLQSIIQELEAANEELQSTNEELDTAKEELQSMNEELNTRNEELTVDDDLTIRRFTPRAEPVFNLIAGDVGRRIARRDPS